MNRNRDMITTFVFGAGVSHAYGYPLGRELVNQIKNQLDPRGERDFLERLNIINPSSIDSFLKSFPAFAQRGKELIANILFSRENVQKFSGLDEHLYQLFFNKIGPENFSNYRVISFNYDRSFEFYILRTLTILKNCSWADAFEMMKPLRILHMHGRLPFMPGEPGYLSDRGRADCEYGFCEEGTSFIRVLRSDDGDEDFPQYDPREIEIKHKSELILKHGRQNFKLVDENGSENGEAKAIIDESSRIFFLGFGFHDVNMSILGFDANNRREAQKIAGTCLNKGVIDVKEIQKKYPAVRKLHDVDSMRFFRDYHSINDHTIE